MLEKLPAIEVPAGRPFLNDLLDRSASATTLADLLTSPRKPFVLTLSAPWGTGKTTFGRMVLAVLRDRGYPSIYLNAWRADSTDEPLVALLAEFESALTSGELGAWKEPGVQQAWRTAKSSAAEFVGFALPIAAQLGLEAGLGAATGTGLLRFLTQARRETIADKASDHLEARLSAYRASKDALQRFQDSLRTLVEGIARRSGGARPPVVILIDDLDRCRPDYAVTLLERIKHLFHVPHVVFVLAIDRVQLGNAVRGVFGRDTDTTGYLQRIVDYDYPLETFTTDTFVKGLFDAFQMHEVASSRGVQFTEVEWMRATFRDLALLFDLSLRAQEQCLTDLRLVVGVTPSGTQLHSPLLLPLVVMRSVSPMEANGFLRGRVGSRVLLDALGEGHRGAEFLDSPAGMRIEAYLRLAEAEDGEAKDPSFWHGSGERVKPLRDAMNDAIRAQGLMAVTDLRRRFRLALGD